VTNSGRFPPGLTFRLLIGSGALLAFVIVAFVLMLNAISGLESANDTASYASDRLVLSSQLRGVAIDSQTAVRGFVITGEDKFLDPRERALRTLPALEAVARTVAPVSGVPARSLEQIVAEVRSYLASSGQLLRQSRTSLRRARAQVATGLGEHHLDQLRSRIARYQQAIASAGMKARSDARASAHQAIVFGVIGVIAASLLIVLLTALAAIRVIRPLRRFTASARRIQAGDLDADVPQGGPGEVGLLAASLNAMTGTLRSNREEREEREAESEAQRAELELTLADLGAERDQAERYRRFIDRLAAEQGKLRPLALTMLEELCLTSASDFASLYVIDERGGTDRFWLAATVGMDKDALPGLIEPDEGVVGRAARSHRTVVLSRSEATLEGISLAGGSRVTDEVHLALEQAGRVIGVVSLGRGTGEPFDAREIDRLETKARSAAVALSNSLSLRSAADAAELNQAVLDTAQDAYVAVNREGVVQTWNSEATALFGYDEAEASGQLLADLIIPSEERERDRQRRAKLMSEATHGGHIDPYELWVQDKSGRRRLVEVSASTVRRGSDWLLSLFTRDVTERSMREKQHRAEEIVSRTLAEADARTDLIEPIIVALGESFEWPLGCFWEYDERADALHVTRLWNGVGALGVELERLTNEATLRLQMTASNPTVTERACLTGESQWGLRADSNAGSERAEAARVAGVEGVVAIPVRGGDGVLGVLEFGLTSNDPPDPTLLRALRSIGDLIGQVIERRRAEEDADRLKNEFFALVSHELRTPLTSVIGYLDIVREDDEGGLTEEQDRYLGIIDRNARRLLRLVGDLLFVAQVEAGTLSLEKGEVDLQRVALDAVEAARPRAEKAEVTLGADTAPVVLDQGDADRLGQLVDNLISNALKFTPAGGSVEVRLRRREGTAVLEVSDTGIGISADDQEHLFERFFRTERATERAIPGIGLGLSICAAIVQGSGGKISIHSAEGAGTTFQVQLPLTARPSFEPLARDDAMAGSVE
jgi:PAS domain S-box-containing protein